MKAILWLMICLTAWAQETQPPAKPETAPPAAPPAKEVPDAKKPAEAATPAADATTPAADRWITGSVDLGYRWNTGPGGNENVYRSIVDLGEGPKLLNADFSIFDSKHRWFDQIDTRAANWGDDPYTTLDVSVRKSRVYDFVASYRNLAYFNNLPTFANPLLDRGILTSEQAFDMHNRMSSYELSFRPGTWFVPYVAYERSSGYGTGVSTFITDQNEYAAPLSSNYSQNNMRGGFRIEMNRYHIAIEQGGTTYRDDEALFQSTGASNPGNRNTPYLGNTLTLNGLSQAYGVRGDSVYTKATGTAQVASWLSLYGQFLYARPRNETNYQQLNSGNFVLQSQLLSFTSQQYLLSSVANVPHQSELAGAEIRILPRLRAMTNWLTDRVRVSGENTGQNQISNGGPAQKANVADSTALRNDYNHAEADLFWDVTSHLTLRGGYRYEWGTTTNVLLPLSGLTGIETAAFRRNIGKAGFTYRVTSKFSVTGDAESAGTGAAYYRTSLYRYRKGRLQGSYQAGSQFTFSGAFTALSNENPEPGVNYDYLGLQSSASVLWNPRGDKRFGFQGTYTRATVRSDISFLTPQTLQPDWSRYRDNSHTIQSTFELRIPKLGPEAKLSAGGAFFLSSGSRPTNYFEPVGKLVLPFHRHVAWVSEWTYYGYSESFYSFENFRTHLITTGVRLTL